MEEGKTDHALRRHVAGINRVHHHRWPKDIDGAPTGLHGAGEPIALPRGLVLGGDMTDDGGGQVAHPGGPLPRPGHANLLPGDGWQLAQFSEHYRQGAGGDSMRHPAYLGLGNHDLDQDGPTEALDWYREELRGYVKPIICGPRLRARRCRSAAMMTKATVTPGIGAGCIWCRPTAACRRYHQGCGRQPAMDRAGSGGPGQATGGR